MYFEKSAANLIIILQIPKIDLNILRELNYWNIGR